MGSDSNYGQGRNGVRLDILILLAHGGGEMNGYRYLPWRDSPDIISLGSPST